MIMKHKQSKETVDLLRRVGYNAIKEKKHGKYKVPFPDLKVDVKIPLSNCVVYTPMPPKELPEGAKIFPVGNSHKQGMELILPSEVKYMGGNKQ